MYTLKQISLETNLPQTELLNLWAQGAFAIRKMGKLIRVTEEEYQELKDVLKDMEAKKAVEAREKWNKYIKDYNADYGFVL